MSFTGETRGYCFVCYSTPEDAKRAIKELNGYEIRPGKYIGVIPSVDNRKLWISGIPKNRSPTDIKDGMEQLTDGVKNIILYPSLLDKSKTRGYAFVEYESHRAAAIARRKLLLGRIFLCGQEVEKIDWAEPENEVDEEIMSKVKILFLRNLMGSTSEQAIAIVFNNISNGQVERVKKHRDYAFVHFVSREAAEKALNSIKSGKHNLNLDGADVEVTWSKPVDKHAYNARKKLTSLLPNSPFGYPWGLRGPIGIKGLGPPGSTPSNHLLSMIEYNTPLDTIDNNHGQPPWPDPNFSYYYPPYLPNGNTQYPMNPGYPSFTTHQYPPEFMANVQANQTGVMNSMQFPYCSGGFVNPDMHLMNSNLFPILHCSQGNHVLDNVTHHPTPIKPTTSCDRNAMPQLTQPQHHTSSSAVRNRCNSKFMHNEKYVKSFTM